jgi:hypothetical protein
MGRDQGSAELEKDNKSFMVTVHWQGRLGNQLFEYAIGRILAEELGYKLNCQSLNGFSATMDNVPGKEIHSQISFTGQDLDLVFITTHKDKLGYILCGWFQRYEYYQPFKEKIKSWFNRDKKNGSVILTPQDMVIHIRRTQLSAVDSKINYVCENGFLKVGGDKVKFQSQLNIQSGTVIQANEDLLPFEYYSNILDGEIFKRLFIITDCPHDPFLKLFDRYHPQIVSGDLMDDFNVLRSANRIVMSMSTFSWWGSFLSDATKIYMPDVGYGIWGPRFQVNLKVTDESRYKFVPVVRDGNTFF